MQLTYGHEPYRMQAKLYLRKNFYPENFIKNRKRKDKKYTTWAVKSKKEKNMIKENVKKKKKEAKFKMNRNEKER